MFSPKFTKDWLGFNVMCCSLNLITQIIRESGLKPRMGQLQGKDRGDAHRQC